MKPLFVLATFFFAFSAIAQDYVGRAQSSCAPLKGRSGYDECVARAARDICDVLQSPYDRLACSQDFERYHAAQVEYYENKRLEAQETTRRLIEQMQRPAP